MAISVSISYIILEEHGSMDITYYIPHMTNTQQFC